MGIFDDITGFLQKPQSIATGAVEGLYNQAFRGGKPSKATTQQRSVNRMLDDLEAAGVDTTQWSGLRGADNDTSTVFSGIVSGAKGNIRPSDAVYSMSDADPTEQRGHVNDILSSAVDLGADPLMALGPAAKAGKLGSLAKGAATVGKVDDLSRGQKAAQLGRQLYQGYMATGEPITGLSAGLLGIRQAENAAVKWGPKLADAAGRRINKSVAASQGAGAAEPLALNAGPQPTVREASVIPGFDDPIPGGPTGTSGMNLRQLNPAPGSVFEAGPVGSTGGLNPQAQEALAGLSGGPQALPPAFGTSGGFPMGTGAKDPSEQLLEILIREAQRLRG